MISALWCIAENIGVTMAKEVIASVQGPIVYKKK